MHKLLNVRVVQKIYIYLGNYQPTTQFMMKYNYWNFNFYHVTI